MENDSTDKAGDPHKPVQSNIVIENGNSKRYLGICS